MPQCTPTQHNNKGKKGLIVEHFVYPMCWQQFTWIKYWSYPILASTTLKDFSEIMELRVSVSFTYLPSWNLTISISSENCIQFICPFINWIICSV
jgi:hypothetical protein